MNNENNKNYNEKLLICLFVSFIVIIVIFMLLVTIKTNGKMKNIEKSKYPLGLIYEQGYCVSDGFVENDKGEIRKITSGNKFLYTINKEYTYILVNKEVWKVIRGNFVSINNVDKCNKEIENIKKEEKNEKEKEEIKVTPTINPTPIVTTTPTTIPILNNFFKPGDYVGTIKCNNEKISLNANVVYGESQDIIDRYDICISTPPGSGKPMLCGGHSTNSLSNLKHIEVNDIITIETNYGLYEYKVISKNIGYVLPINESTSSEDFLKDIYTHEELFTLKGNKEILQLYTCIYLNDKLEVVEVNEEDTPTRYRLAIRAEIINALKKER